MRRGRPGDPVAEGGSPRLGRPVREVEHLPHPLVSQPLQFDPPGDDPGAGAGQAVQLFGTRADATDQPVRLGVGRQDKDPADRVAPGARQ